MKVETKVTAYDILIVTAANYKSTHHLANLIGSFL